MFKKIQPKIIELKQQVDENLLRQIDINIFKALNDEDEDQWCIGGQEFEEQTIPLIFAYSYKINISILVFKKHANYTFLYRILRPKFEQLIFLKLCDNSMTSIEPICFIDAPNLQEINVGCNRLLSLKPLVKVYSLNVNQISIDKNMIIDPQNFCKYLSRYPLGGKNKACSMIKAQTKSMPREGYPSLQFQDLSFIAKQYFQFLADLKFLHSTRIDQETVRLCRRRKNLGSIPCSAPIYQ